MGRLLDANRQALAEMLGMIDELEEQMARMKALCAERVEAAVISPTPDGADATSMALAVNRRLHETFERLHLEISPLGEAAPPSSQVSYILKDFFTTELGSWEVGQNWEFGLPQWARDAYLKAYGDPHYFDDAGGDHHLFGAVFDEYGQLIPNLPFVFAWPDGQAAGMTKHHSGWANQAIYSKYNPDAGERGAWSWWPNVDGHVEAMTGASLPFGRHVSFFAVWQKVAALGQLPQEGRQKVD